MTNSEEWRPCLAPGYAVSNLGRVQGPRRILKPDVTRSGYLLVRVYANRRGVSFGVHSLVAAAFLGPCPTGHQINHIDGDKANNVATNLEYVTASANVRHAYALGLRMPTSGELNGMRKLSASDVLAIREARSLGAGCVALAKQYGVTHGAISMASRGKTWRHL